MGSNFHSAQKCGSGDEKIMSFSFRRPSIAADASNANANAAQEDCENVWLAASQSIKLLPPIQSAAGSQPPTCLPLSPAQAILASKRVLSPAFFFRHCCDLRRKSSKWGSRPNVPPPPPHAGSLGKSRTFFRGAAGIKIWED